MRTVGYLRVSTERQTDGAGLDQQKASITAWAEASGVVIDEWASDSETGMVVEREEIQRILGAARLGAVRRLVVDRMDRLGRKLVVIEALYEDFTKAGVEICCVQQPLGAGHNGAMVRQINAAVAQYQRAELLSHMRKCKIQTIARKGTYGGGGAPYGYVSLGNGRLGVDPRGAELVVRAFHHRACGLSLTSIVTALDAEGFRTKKGTRLHPMQVSRILAREDVYRGLKPVHNVTLEDGVKPQHPGVL